MRYVLFLHLTGKGTEADRVFLTTELYHHCGLVQGAKVRQRVRLEGCKPQYHGLEGTSLVYRDGSPQASRMATCMAT